MLVYPDRTASDLAIMRWLRQNQQSEFARLGLIFPALTDPAGTRVDLSLANIQNCLCEFHKFVKISEGTGRGRRKFVPTTALHALQLGLNLPEKLDAS